MKKPTAIVGFLFFCSLIFLNGCGAGKDAKTAEAILSANILLTSGKCQEAINILEGNGRVNNNAVYLQTLASAYACLNGYREPSFFTTDLPLTNTPAPLGGMAKYTNASNMTSATDSDFSNMQKAIEILIYAGGLSTDVNPSADLRATKFTEAETLDINTQLLLMILEQLGRFYRYYGDSSATGVKGSGPGTNTCFASYENVALDVGVDLTTNLGLGTSGACVAVGAGHTDFGVANAFNTARLCNGVVLVNNLFDILPKVLGTSTSTDFSSISTLQTTITALRTAVTTAKSGTSNVLNVTSQTLCESQNATNDDYIQVYYALIMERLFL